MKVLLTFLTAIFLLSSCNSSTKENGTSTDSDLANASSGSLSADSVDVKRNTTTSREEPTSSTIYEGTLPCTDCEGVKTLLELGENFRYVLSETNIGKDSEAQSKGYYNKQMAFAGDPIATLLTLSDSKTGDQKYFMQYKDTPNELLPMDSKKKVLGGDNPFKLVKK